MIRGLSAAVVLCLSACTSTEPAEASRPSPPPSEAAPSPAPSEIPAATGSETAAGELEAWQQAVHSGEVDRMIARVGEPITFRAKRMLERPPEATLDRDALRAALEAGQARLLGLHKGHLLPRTQDLVSSGPNRATAVDPHCPSVTWIFERRGDRWFLDEVAVELLEC